MRKKDAIAYGILEGNFVNEQQARFYCETNNLKVEFKSTSSKGAFLMKVSDREGWITPKSWVNNYMSELRRQFSELSERLENLGEPTSEPVQVQNVDRSPIILFSPTPNQRDKIYFDDIAQSILRGVRESNPENEIMIRGRRMGSERLFSSADEPGVADYLAKMMSSLNK